MIATLLAILGLIVAGGRATDRLRTAELESILSRLPADEAGAYYELLRRRIRKVGLLRAIALASLVCLFYALRQLLAAPR